ncbi:hypothetical protein C2S53_010767 [Perilla frutescens var. hirtella]|uniref:Peptide N-acetyl-beta-D-glucosaminyl asparaginase amidase A N-terminal domain-containing protein n=1 Tax=Perilla frutescens var. hirtella TaxID=608512 RepID=A0AAD4JNZ4_PERFH|nr:hypothetical protein C2S53_010767 [Perilla frutescens var. hirtella]
MHLSLLLFLLSLTLISSPPPSAAAPPQQYIEVTAPLLFDSLTPSCTLPLLSHSFANTTGHPPTNATYSSPPTNCTWSNAVLHFSAASNGSQPDRTAAVWLSGSELLRTTTAEPTADGIFWNFRKDVTRYASLLRQSNLSLSVMLDNVLDDLHTGIFHVNVTFLYYDVVNTTDLAANTPLSLFRPDQNSVSLELNANPADLILPISSAGDEGFWFKIESESDSVSHGIEIPANTYRAVIEIYVSFHKNDAFWYTNPSDYYLEMNNLTTQRGHGAYREVLVKLDGNVIGSVIPFPVIYSGGINPLFWEPLVSMGTFNLPSYEQELTPFLGMLLDGNRHFLGINVAAASSYWLVDANLHLWLDQNSSNVEAGPIKYTNPSSCVERQAKFHELDGKFKIEGERKSEFSGWVNSTAGNFTTYVYSKVEFENKIVFKHNGTSKSVKQEVKVVDKVEVKSALGHSVSNVSRERRYPLKLTTTAMPGSEKDSCLMTSELDHSLKEEKKENGDFKRKSENRQKCRGWMFVGDGGILSGAAATSQSYHVKDSYGCYTRRVLAAGGSIKNDTHNCLCAAAA